MFITRQTRSNQLNRRDYVFPYLIYYSRRTPESWSSLAETSLTARLDYVPDLFAVESKFQRLTTMIRAEQVVVQKIEFDVSGGSADQLIVRLDLPTKRDWDRFEKCLMRTFGLMVTTP